MPSNACAAHQLFDTTRPIGHQILSRGHASRGRHGGSSKGYRLVAMWKCRAFVFSRGLFRDGWGTRSLSPQRRPVILVEVPLDRHRELPHACLTRPDGTRGGKGSFGSYRCMSGPAALCDRGHLRPVRTRGPDAPVTTRRFDAVRLPWIGQLLDIRLRAPGGRAGCWGGRPQDG